MGLSVEHGGGSQRFVNNFNVKFIFKMHRYFDAIAAILPGFFFHRFWSSFSAFFLTFHDLMGQHFNDICGYKVFENSSTQTACEQTTAVLNGRYFKSGIFRPLNVIFSRSVLKAGICRFILFEFHLVSWGMVVNELG